jgi:hypothetical protein
MAGALPNSGLFGNSNRKRKQRNARSEQGKNAGKAPKLSSYCPVCTNPDASKPQNAPRASVMANTKIARCKAGHLWHVGGYSRTEPVVIIGNEQLVAGM